MVSLNYSFLGLVESSPIDANTKALYRNLNEIWPAMVQHIEKVNRHKPLGVSTEQLSAILLQAFFKRRFKIFHDWLRQENEKMNSQIDFPLEMTVPITTIYMETIGKLHKSLFDESLTKPMRPKEEKIRAIFFNCATNFCSLSSVQLHSEFLCKRFVLLQDPYLYPSIKSNWKRAFTDELKEIDPEMRGFFDKFDAESFNFIDLQLCFSNALNWMINDHLIGLAKRIQNIYSSAQAEIKEIQQWRHGEKRKFDDERQEWQKKARLIEENSRRFATIHNKAIAELDKIREERVKSQDKLALDADETIRALRETIIRHQNTINDLQSKAEALSAENASLKKSAKGFLGIFS